MGNDGLLSTVVARHLNLLLAASFWASVSFTFGIGQSANRPYLSCQHLILVLPFYLRRVILESSSDKTKKSGADNDDEDFEDPREGKKENNDVVVVVDSLNPRHHLSVH